MAAFFEADSLFGTLTDWEPETGGGKSETTTRASVLGKDGDEFAHKDYDGKDSVSCVYNAKKFTGTLTVPKAGQVVGNYHIDSVAVAYAATAFPKLTITGHKHTDAGAAGHTNVRTYTGTVSLPAVALGVPASLGVLAATGARSANWSLSCSHIDEVGGAGVQVASNNYDGVETVSMESVNEITFTNDSDSSWTKDSDVENKSNNAATAHTMSATHHVSHDVAQGA